MPDMEGSNIASQHRQTASGKSPVKHNQVRKPQPTAAQGAPGVNQGASDTGDVQSTSGLQVLDLSQLNPQNIQHGIQQLTGLQQGGQDKTVLAIPSGVLNQINLTQMLPNQAYTVLSVDSTGAVSMGTQQE